MIPPSVPFWYPPWYTDHLHGQIPRRAERWADSAVSTLFHEFRILSSSSLSIYLLSCVSSRKRGLISDDDDDSRCLLISNRSIYDRSMDRWFFTRFSLVAKKVTLRVVDPWRARDRIVKLLRALRDFILFRFILFPFFSLSFFLSPSSRYGKSWERTRSVANAREFSMSKTCSIHRLGDPNESESTMKASGW